MGWAARKSEGPGRNPQTKSYRSKLGTPLSTRYYDEATTWKWNAEYKRLVPSGTMIVRRQIKSRMVV
jgi:hypothetical protein